MFAVNNPTPTVMVLDDFYENPMAVREWVLQQEFPIVRPKKFVNIYKNLSNLLRETLLYGQIKIIISMLTAVFNIP